MAKDVCYEVVVFFYLLLTIDVLQKVEHILIDLIVFLVRPATFLPTRLFVIYLR